jgi:dihydroorotate dehydrogenase subfamily 1
LTQKSTYEIIYENFLSKIPERQAKKIGINLLRLPFDFLGNFETEDKRLRTKIGSLELPNPVILAACYHEPHMIRRAMNLGFGAVTLKTTELPKRGNPEPTIVRRGEGFVNCIGFRNPGMVKCRRSLEKYNKTKPLIINIASAADSPDKHLNVIDYLDKHTDMIELNISCPNVKEGLHYSKYPRWTKEFFKEIREATEKPIIVKLSPKKEFETDNYEIILPNAASSGIDAVNYSNARPVCEKRLSMGEGGLSGPELYENMLENVERIYKEFGMDIDIIATGGIDSPEKAYEAISKGAKCVSYMTAFVTKGPFLAKRINTYLSEKMDERGMSSISEMVGFYD